MKSMKAMMKSIDEMKKAQTEGAANIDATVEKVEGYERVVAKSCRETKEAERRMNANEALVGNYVEICKQSEDYTRGHYRRTAVRTLVYASALCKEVSNSCLPTLEAALRILQPIISLKRRV